MTKRSLTRRELAQQSNAWDQHYALLSGKPAKYQQPVPDARKPRQASGEIAERDILKAIMQLLKQHPKVARVWRQNSGTFQMQYGAKSRFVRANTARGMSDIAGVLKTGRAFFIEVKARKGVVHEHQQQFLDDVAAGGALALVARSVDDVINALEGICTHPSSDQS